MIRKSGGRPAAGSMVPNSFLLTFGERMSEPVQHEPPSATGLGLGVYFFAGPVVVALAGMGGYFGERLAGAFGYWVGCYLAAILAAILAGWLFAENQARRACQPSGRLAPGLFTARHLVRIASRAPEANANSRPDGEHLEVFTSGARISYRVCLGSP
jgi:hypothetical protein